MVDKPTWRHNLGGGNKHHKNAGDLKHIPRSQAIAVAK